MKLNQPLPSQIFFPFKQKVHRKYLFRLQSWARNALATMGTGLHILVWRIA